MNVFDMVPLNVGFINRTVVSYQRYSYSVDTLLYASKWVQGCPVGLESGGYGPIDQLFDQILQFDQLNWHLYDADLVGQTESWSKGWYFSKNA